MLEDLYRDAEIFDFIYSSNNFNSVWTGKGMNARESHIFSPLSINDELINNPDFNLANFLYFSRYNDPSLGIDRPLSRTIGIDYRLLNDKVINQLAELYNYGVIFGIRLLPEGTVLTTELYDKLDNMPVDDDFLIAADDAEVDSRFNLKLQSSICTFEKVEVYNNETNSFDIHNNIHVSHELNDEELKKLVELANSGCDNIFLNFYDPSYYSRALEILSQNGLNNNINITILANPLYDSPTIYSDLANKNYNVKINYNSCNDLNMMYQRYRSSEVQNYYSDIEASGVCDLSEYLDMLNMIQKVETHVKEKRYSNLEKLAYLYDSFKEKYIYNPDYDENNHSVDANLHVVSQRDRMVCEGFSNLYSCLARRLGIPCFTVGVDDHQYNVVRVTDPKYNVDSISLLDVTWDIGKERKINDNFENFLRPADAKLYDMQATTLNTVSSLFVSQEDYDRYCILYSNPGYVRQHFSYTRRMLELMGLGILNNSPTDNDVRSAFMNSNFNDMIPTGKITSAINYVRAHEGENYSDNYPTLDERAPVFSNPRIRENWVNSNNLYVPYDVNLHVPDKSIHFVDIEPQHSRLYPPRAKYNHETDEQYREYLNSHYHNFYINNLSYDSYIVSSNDEELIDNDMSSDSSADSVDDNEVITPDGSTNLLNNDELVPSNGFVNLVGNSEAVTPNDSEINDPDIDFRSLALQNYSNSGYGQNVDGHYYNIWIDEYDPNYKPWEDAAFNPNINEENSHQINH